MAFCIENIWNYQLSLACISLITCLWAAGCEVDWEMGLDFDERALLLFTDAATGRDCDPLGMELVELASTTVEVGVTDVWLTDKVWTRGKEDDCMVDILTGPTGVILTLLTWLEATFVVPEIGLITTTGDVGTVALVDVREASTTLGELGCA